MRNFFKVFGIIALTAIIGFSMTACPEDDGGGPVHFDDKLELSGDVYTVDYDEDSWFPEYIKYTGTLTLKSDVGGSGKIEGGKLTYAIEVPPAAKLESITGIKTIWAQMGLSSITISDESAKWVQIQYLGVSGSSDYDRVDKRESSGKISESSVSGTYQQVMFVYVDKDVELSAKGGTVEDGEMKTTIKDVSLSLKKGWNAIHVEESASTNFETETGTGTRSFSLGNPELRWVLN